MQLLMAMSNPTFSEPNDRRNWQSSVKKSFTDYISLMQGIEPQKLSDKEREMIRFYEEEVKHSKVQIVKDKDGKLKATSFRKKPKIKI